jgi:hypothetical protein
MECMSHRRNAIVGGWCLLSLALSRGMAEEVRADQSRPDAESRQQAALLAEVGPGFRIHRTPHCIVAFDTEESVVVGLGSRLEQTFNMVYRFCEEQEIEARPPDKPLEVIFFQQRADYHRYAAGQRLASAGTYGVYSQETNRSAFFNLATDTELAALEAAINSAREGLERLQETMDGLKGRSGRLVVTFGDGERIEGTHGYVRKRVSARIDDAREQLDELDGTRREYVRRINLTVIQHEAVHQVLFNAGVHVRGAQNPKWLVEGLACTFETPPISTGIGFRAVNVLRLQDLREAIGGNRAGRRLTADRREQGRSSPDGGGLPRRSTARRPAPAARPCRRPRALR